MATELARRRQTETSSPRASLWRAKPWRGRRKSNPMTGGDSAPRASCASLAGEKKYAEAEPLLLEGYQGMLARKDRIAVLDRYHMELAHQWIVQLYQAW